MKTLIKRLFGITRLENELAGTWAELEATNLALLTERALRRDMMKEREAQFGEWKPKKNGKGYYRRIKYPLAMPLWRTETAQSLPRDPFDDELDWERRTNL
jgi:hypothetical protein